MNEQQTQVLTGTQTGSRIVIDLAAENPFTQFFCGDEPEIEAVINDIQHGLALCTIGNVDSCVNAHQTIAEGIAAVAEAVSLLMRVRDDFKKGGNYEAN